MPGLIEKTIREAVEEKYPLPEEIQMLITQATYDLYYGPWGVEEIDGYIYPGFASACDQISDAVDEVSDLYIDIQSGEAFEHEPEPWTDEETGEVVEPYYEDWYHLDRKEVLKYLVGKELATYI